MKLGEVLRREREKAKLSAADMAARVRMSVVEYESVEAGGTPAERWGPLLARIAIELDVPTSRLVAKSGRAADATKGGVGALVRARREQQGKPPAAMATALGISEDEYKGIEAGSSPLESLAPTFLAFAEAIDQPVFNLFFPVASRSPSSMTIREAA